MRRLATFVLLVVVASPALGEGTKSLPEQGLLFERALAQVDLAPRDVRINRHELALWGQDKYAIRLLDLFRDDPWKLGPYARTLSSQLLKDPPDLGMLVTGAHGKLDAGVRIGLIGDPLAAERARVQSLGADSLAVALAEITGRPASSYLEDGKYDLVPPALRDAAALFLLTVPRAVRFREAGLLEPVRAAGLDPEKAFEVVRDVAVETFEEGGKDDEAISDLAEILTVEKVLDRMDESIVNTGATLIAIAAQEARKMLVAGAGPAGAPFRWYADTPYGMVALAGGGNDKHPAGDYLLLVDTGGDDTYGACAATRDIAHPVSVAIDLSGNDTYRNAEAERPAFGAGVFGYAVLIDGAGNDTYEITFAGEGAGILGTGVLLDLAGDDRYAALGNAQGSGSFGTGLLVDAAGNDHYDIYKMGQGFGFTRGAGMLLDFSGNDRYQANMTDHFNGGPYGADHHVHFVQGSGLGRRGDYFEGHSWAGGFGILVDGAGDDRYEADCYGQGNAYWHAIGMIVDKAGSDVYYGGEYSLAAAPHFAIGLLQDDGGDDRYTVTIRQCLGHGRDWSIAWFEDAAGNDFYQGTRSVFGASHVNSVSLFWDLRGDDTYIANGPSFGESEAEHGGSIRDWLPTTAIFVDGGGRDRYLKLPTDGSLEATSKFLGEIRDLSRLEPRKGPGDNRRWVRTAPAPGTEGFRGVGIDASR